MSSPVKKQNKTGRKSCEGSCLQSHFILTESWTGGVEPLCSTECTIVAPEFSYIRGHTYSYSYTGKSQVELKGMEGGMSKLEWQKKVELTWLTPCDVAITVNVSGSQGK